MSLSVVCYVTMLNSTTLSALHFLFFKIKLLIFINTLGQYILEYPKLLTYFSGGGIETLKKVLTRTQYKSYL